jgi:adenylate cyclase
VLDELAELQAAGVYDPEAPDADFRRTVAAYLRSIGFDREAIVAVLAAPNPAGEATRRLLFPGEHLPAEQFAARVGLTMEELRRIRAAAGLPPVAPMNTGAQDEGAFAAIKLGIAMFGEDALLEFLRVSGAALAQVAEAAVAMFGTRIAAPLDAQDAPPVARFEAEIEATRALVGAGRGLDTLFRLHAETAIRRLNRAQEGAASFGSGRMAVGFVDLVGFTPLSERLTIAELSETFAVFEATAYEVIAEHDARLVKLIGDAVMFTALDADVACEIALTLVERFAHDGDPVTPRGALAVGEMLLRGGDYYGPVVNLAARAADLAVPLEILVSDDVIASAGPNFRFDPAGRRMLKGFAEPIALSTLTRAE